MEQKHSGFGIASFIISLLTGMGLCLAIAILTFLEYKDPGLLDRETMISNLLGLVIIAGIAVDLVAIGLGLAGLLHKNHKKIFAILGTIFAALGVVGITALIVFGPTIA